MLTNLLAEAWSELLLGSQGSEQVRQLLELRRRSIEEFLLWHKLSYFDVVTLVKVVVALDKQAWVLLVLVDSEHLR